MPAFRIFDPYAFLLYEDQTAIPAKVAKPAKATQEEPGTLATLAALAAPPLKTGHDRAPIDEPVLLGGSARTACRYRQPRRPWH
jgi:hypothetical protein